MLHTVDNRFAVPFTAAERAQLARPSDCSGPAEGPQPFVATVLDGAGRLAVCQSARADR